MCVGGVVRNNYVVTTRARLARESDIRWETSLLVSNNKCQTTLFYFKGLFTKSLMSDIKIPNQSVYIIYRETLLSPYGHQSIVAAVTCSYNSKLGLRSDVRF